MTKEDSLQIAVMDYIRYQYPGVLAVHIANERYISDDKNKAKRVGGFFKRKGVVAGMPDVLIFEKKHQCCGMAIELKIKPDTPTKSQQQILIKLFVRGWLTAVCYGFDAAKHEIDTYLK